MSTKNKDLTPRETEVLRDIAAGRSSKQIAEEYRISVHTVGVHRYNIIHKTGCTNTVEAAIKFSKGLIS